MLNRVLCVIWLAFLLNACGGGHASSGGRTSVQSSVPQNSSVTTSSTPTSSSASPMSSSSASFSSLVASVAAVKISGKVTYDYVPHNANHVGLNYAGTIQRPVRGATVELVDAQNLVQSVTTTSDLGDYEFSVSQNTNYKIRVKAETKSTTAPTWNFTVVDNTSGDSIYSLVGSLVSSGTADSTRDLNASSGWDVASSSYLTSPRPAAPFAILDTLYLGMKRFNSFGNSRNFSKLVAHWSTKNKAVNGNIVLGEIETTYYSGGHIYVLGDANNDIDEYDASTILHEFGHYIEDNFFRSDSMGGNHAQGDSLDFRVSMAEGFANAFSGMMLASPYYEDASGAGQANGGFINLSQKNRVHKGYYDEGSVESILYNYYAASGTNKTAEDASKIFSVLSSNGYVNAISFTSIFLFTDQLINQFPDQQTVFYSLLSGQNISGTDQYGTNEVDTGGLQSTWPIYKTLVVDSTSAVNICSSPLYGKFNKLGNSAFLKIVLPQPASYTISVLKAGGDAVVSKPEILVFHRGIPVAYGKNSVNDTHSLTVNLQADSHILEVYDVNNHDSKNIDNSTLCFDIKVKKI